MDMLWKGYSLSEDSLPARVVMLSMRKGASVWYAQSTYHPVGSPAFDVWLVEAIMAAEKFWDVPAWTKTTTLWRRKDD